MKRIFSTKTFAVIAFAVFASFFLVLAAIDLSGEEEEQPRPARTSTRPRTVKTAPATAPPQAGPQGIKLDPNLQSATGMPNPEEMKLLIGLQAGVPFPVMVPTNLPGGYVLDAGSMGAAGPTNSDPVGYYSYRYSDPANASRTLTFNQSRANSRELSGYYLTEVNINGTDFQVYWHQTLDYLPAGAPVRTVAVGKAESFVVVWKGSYNDATGQPRELFYSMSTGTWTGHGWGDISYIIEGLKPLSAVGG